MRIVHDQVPEADCRAADTLLVLLPGVYDTPEDFLHHGFVSTLRQRGLAVDVALADAHLGYYSDHSVVARLRDDIVAPARASYQHIWLAGISLGGFGALAYAMEHPGEVDGLMLLAPYLGTRGVQQEILAAGGLSHWQPGPLSADDGERRLWQWIARPAVSGEPRPEIWLGFGHNDRFAPAHRMLAASPPDGHSIERPGGHDWPVWRHLWDALLDRGPLSAGPCPRVAQSSATFRP